MDPVLAKEVQNLLDDNRGDEHRLKFILECIQNEKKIYNSDQKYLASLLGEYSKDEHILERLDFKPKPEESGVTFADETDDSKPFSESKKKPVNVILQMIFAVIPILDIYASYKIQKLRLWILIFWVAGGIVSLIYSETIQSGDRFTQFLNNNFDFIYTIDYFIFIIPFAITQAIVMRVWSKKWNKSISVQ